MSPRTWLRSWLPTHPLPTAARRPRTRLTAELLEGRDVPATVSVADASLAEIGSVSPFVAAGSGGLNQPKDLTVGPDGNVYVVSAGTNSVIRYSPTGQLLGTFVASGSGGLSNPRVPAFGPDGNLYVSSIANNNILEYSGSTGAFVTTFVAAGSGGLNYPGGMAFGPDGNLYVSSAGTESVDRFQGPLGAAPGSPLPAAGQSGATFVTQGSGGLAGPGELTFGPNGNLFVSNASPAVSGVTNNNYGVLEFDAATGTYVTTYVGQGAGGLDIPRGLGFDQDGRLYVADFGTNAIHRYDGQGNYLDDPVAGPASPLQVALGLAFDAQGGLLVGSRDGNAVYRYDRGVTVTLSAASATPVSVGYATADGTATAPGDYTAESGTVAFAPGQTSRLVLLVTHEEQVQDGNETFGVQLSNPTGATVGAGTGTVTIAEPVRQLTVGGASAIEGDHSGHYRGPFVNDGYGQYNPVTFGPDGNLYTAVGTGPGYNTIRRYNGTTGAFMDTFASGPINGVRDIVFRAGSMYVGSEYTDEVLRYDASTGAFLGVFVTAGSGGIDGPVSLSFGPDANGDGIPELYVSGRNNATVDRYDGATGQPLGAYVTPGSGGLSLAEGMTFDPAQTYLYVASSGTNQVLKYDARTGAYLGALPNAGVSGPHDVAFGPDGLMYVTSGGNNRILRYTAGGAYLDDFVPAGSGGMVNPHQMSFGPDGDLYLTTTGNKLVLRFGTENEAVFPVSVSAASTLPLTINYATADGTAVAGRDYAATGGTLTLAPGVTTGTVRVPVLDDGAVQSSLSFTLTVSSPATTNAQAQGMAAVADGDAPTKFYVANDATPTAGGANATFRYQASGSPEAPSGLNSADLDPRGVAANAAGTKEWVVDANKTVYVYGTGGALLGSWAAGGLGSSATLTGITTNGTDIWLVDSYSDKVYKYAGAAGRLSGSQTAAGSFSLNNKNGNAQDIVTDGTSFWVVDGTALKVFKYTLSGSLLGSWGIDPADAHPTGITINPANVGDIWIVDNGTLKVYDYANAAGRTSGSQAAAATFALNPSDTNPQGIADPPPASAADPAAEPAAPSTPVAPDRPAGRDLFLPSVPTVGAPTTSDVRPAAPPLPPAYWAAPDGYDFAPIDVSVAGTKRRPV